MSALLTIFICFAFAVAALGFGSLASIALVSVFAALGVRGPK